MPNHLKYAKSNQQEGTLAERSDFENFVSLDEGQEKLPYIRTNQTYESMKFLVTTQSMNYYLLKQDRKHKQHNTVSQRIMDKKQLPIYE